ncbi:hypothetical protein BDV96DRAFT_31830 [Lophiotrema nucula]|uniref:Uncharacterized protein n=1 Tax=Lophiotrema nucula TaxID=690887 RepID=A0A6A5ZAZ6_9PLEO|nr:hypothetical protein BDV96DRAFT_31830 [Lophiotrema nucula]
MKPSGQLHSIPKPSHCPPSSRDMSKMPDPPPLYSLLPNNSPCRPSNRDSHAPSCDEVNFLRRCLFEILRFTYQIPVPKLNATLTREAPSFVKNVSLESVLKDRPAAEHFKRASLLTLPEHSHLLTLATAVSRSHDCSLRNQKRRIPSSDLELIHGAVIRPARYIGVPVYYVTHLIALYAKHECLPSKYEYAMPYFSHLPIYRSLREACQSTLLWRLISDQTLVDRLPKKPRASFLFRGEIRRMGEKNYERGSARLNARGLCHTPVGYDELVDFCEKRVEQDSVQRLNNSSPHSHPGNTNLPQQNRSTPRIHQPHTTTTSRYCGERTSYNIDLDLRALEAATSESTAVHNHDPRDLYLATLGLIVERQIQSDPYLATLERAADELSVERDLYHTSSIWSEQPHV